MHKKKSLVVIALLLVMAAAAWVWFRQCGGVTHGELKSCVEDESAAIQCQIDKRCATIDAKLDRIEAKLDKLIDMATPRLTNDRRAAE